MHGLLLGTKQGLELITNNKLLCHGATLLTNPMSVRQARAHAWEREDVKNSVSPLLYIYSFFLLFFPQACIY
jgi:hypothetical protein